MTITRAPATKVPVPHDDPSWVPVSAVFGAFEHSIAEEMTVTIESWLDGLPARSVHRQRHCHRKGNGPM